mgnify:CR=1 FL=1
MESSPHKTILVSSCLLGLDCRYNGLCKKNSFVLDFLSAGNWTIIPVCPEQLAGLPTPRPATQFIDGDGVSVIDGNGSVVNSRQESMNALFIKGAEQTVAIAELSYCSQAILKERSPSCGVHQIYRNGKTVQGCGVTTALLNRHGVTVFCEEDLDKLVNSPSLKED